MSDDLVNQITLNFLISKQQLQKLNKRIKQKEEDKMKTDMEIYKDKFVELFLKMLNDQAPSDLLEDVKHSYNYFVEKGIYYLKMKETNNTEASNEVVETKSLEEEDLEADEEDDLDAKSLEEEEDLESEEKSLEEEEDLEAEDEEEDLEEDLEEKTVKIANLTPIAFVKETKYKKSTNTKSKGVDDIQQLPLDWFSKVRQTYKQNQIIPRHKDKQNDNDTNKGVILESPTNYKNTEKKNINRLYEDKTNDKNKKTTNKT
jgi:hypothetical protein